MSPPVTCRLMTELSRAVVEELRRRERGEGAGEAFEHITVVTRPPHLDHSRNRDPSESSSLFVTACSAVASFVDDKISSAWSGELGRELVAIAGCVYHLSGVYEKLIKRVWPDQLQDVLGRAVATIPGTVALPPNKRRLLIVMVREMLACFDGASQHCITVDRLASNVGKLQDAVSGVEGAAFFMFQLRLPLAVIMHLLPFKCQRTRFLIPFFLFPRMRFDLLAWLEVLEDIRSCRRFYVQESGYYGVWKWEHNFFESPLPAGIFSAATDASKKAGAVTFAGARLLHEWSAEEQRLHINILEALMPVWFLQEFGPQVRGLRGVVWVDSMVALRALNAGRSKNVLIAAAARDFKLLCLRHSVQIWVAHIPTLHNLEADYISRGVLGRRIADWGLSSRAMQRWLRLVGGGFHVDAFASPSGDNSRAQRFCSAICPAATFRFELHQHVWAFPPPSLAAATLDDALRWQCATVLLLVPLVDFESRESPHGWQPLEVYNSATTAFGVFHRMVAGSVVRCNAPGFDLILLRRVNQRITVPAHTNDSGRPSRSFDSPSAPGGSFPARPTGGVATE